jgi:excisionase family DNA binding protein
MAIIDLASHPYCFITVGELAEYWRLSRRRILEHLSAGHLEAIQFGAIVRIRTDAARQFEQRAAVPSRSTPGTGPTAIRSAVTRADHDGRSR